VTYLVRFISIALLSALIPALSLHAEPTLSGADSSWAEVLRGQHSEAAESARRILAGDPENARAACCLAEALSRSGRTEEATAYFRNLELANPTSSLGPLGLGVIATWQNDFALAEVLINRALALDPVNGAPITELVCRERLGLTFLRAVRPDEASACFERVLAMADSFGETLASIHANYNLGYTRLNLGLMEEGKGHLELARQGGRRFQLFDLTGDTEILLSLLSRWEMDLDANLTHLESALTAYESAGNFSRQAACLRHMATTATHLREPTVAIQRLRRGRFLALAARDNQEANACLANLAQINHNLGDFDQAVRQWQEAIRVAGDMWPKEWLAGTLTAVGKTLLSQDRQDEALLHIERALNTLDQTSHGEAYSSTLRELGRALIKANRTAEGIQRLQEATAVAAQWDLPLEKGLALNELGHAQLAQSNLSQAEEAFAEAAELVSGKNHYETEISTLSGQARIARQQGRSIEALSVLSEATEIAEGVRRRSRGPTTVRQSTAGSSRQLYEEMIDLLHEIHTRQPTQGFDRRAFNIVQMAKARSLLDMLMEAELNLRFRAHSSFQHREQEILVEIAGLIAREQAEASEEAEQIESEIEDLEDELALLEIQIREADPRYAEILYPQPSTLADLRSQVLKGGELLLEYCLTDSASYLWAVTSDSFGMYRLPARNVIEEQVNALLPLLRDYNLTGSDPAYFAAAVSELSRMLIGPVLDDLADARRVIITPYGILHYLPFEVLLTEDSTGPAQAGAYSALPYLISSTDVLYAPSVSALARLRVAAEADSVPPATELLLVGASAQQAREQLSAFAWSLRAGEPIPQAFVPDEVNSLRGMFPESRRTVLVNKEATPTRFKQAAERGSYRLVTSPPTGCSTSAGRNSRDCC